LLLLAWLLGARLDRLGFRRHRRRFDKSFVTGIVQRRPHTYIH
jgi:hypothetical protein